MAALPQGEVFNEQMWVIYFALAKKDRSLSTITAETWVDLYTQKSKSKFSNFMAERNIEWCVANMPLDSRFNTADAAAARKKFLSKNAGGLDWHNALKSQIVNFIKHQKGKIAASNNFKVTRQGEFYNMTNLVNFFKKVKLVFGSKFSDDRWNPADVWFYKDDAVKEIKDFISHSVTMNSAVFDKLSKSKKKSAAVYDVKQLNELMLVLYEKNKVIPISLKKATGEGAVFTSRVGIVNGRKDKDNQPKDPVITAKKYPIVESGDGYVVGGTRSDGGRNLKYDLKTQVATLDVNGKQVIKTEYDYVTPGNANNIIVASSGEFGAAGGGSISMSEAESVFYTSKGFNSIKESRRDAVPNNANILTDIYGNDIERSKKYMDNISKKLEPNKTSGQLMLSKNEESLIKNNYKALQYCKDAQNKLEMALAIKESGKEDEIIIDLWKSCTSKGIVRRKDFERILGRATREEYYRTKKVGKPITMDEAEKISFNK